MGVVKVRWTVGSIAVSAPSRTRGDTQHNERNAIGEQRNGKRVSGVSCVLRSEVAVGMLGSHEAVDSKEGGVCSKVDYVASGVYLR
jgi:hypothetical protein